jgi:3-(3-hydroxy-phenyl)propionate hydroxylase
MLRRGEDPAPLLDGAGLRRLTAPYLDGQQVTVERAVVYAFHARTADRWRAGRILLAGDAAHVMPPFAGQGFSSGARDAANLAWKLDAVLRGAPDALLDSNGAERAPHVRAMQQLAVRWGPVVQSTRPRAARLRDAFMDTVDGTAAQRWLVDHAKPLPTARAGAFARRPHPLPPLRRVGALFPQPRVRTPDGGPAPARLDNVLPPGWVALTTTPGSTGAFAAAGVPVLELGVDLHDVDGDVAAWLRGAGGATWVLLRPDRFVFACGRDRPALDAALTALRAQLGAALGVPGPGSG